MRWIKASIRNPSLIGEYYSVKYWRGKRGSALFTGNGWVEDHSGSIAPEDFEWLDESVQDVPDTNVGDIPDWLKKWTAEWLHKMECQGVDPKVRDGFKDEIEWLFGKIIETEIPASRGPHIGIDTAKGPHKTAYLKYHNGSYTPISKEEFESTQDTGEVPAIPADVVELLEAADQPAPSPQTESHELDLNLVKENGGINGGSADEDDFTLRLPPQTEERKFPDWVSWRTLNGWSMLPNASWVKKGDPLTSWNTESLYALYESDKAKHGLQHTQTEERGEVPEEIMEWIKANERRVWELTAGDKDHPSNWKMGAIEMYFKLNDGIADGLPYWVAQTRNQREKVITLQSQLSEAQHDRDVYKEWNAKAEKTVVALTDQLAVKVAALEEIVKDSQHIKSNPNCGYILKLAEDALK